MNKTVLCRSKTFWRECPDDFFGSRIADSKKGGDIDLLIIPEKSEEGEVKKTFKQKMAMSVDLEMVFGHRSIDLLVEYPNDDRTILKTAREKGITLC